MSKTGGPTWRSADEDQLSPKAKQEIRLRLSEMAELYWAQRDKTEYRGDPDDGDKFRIKDLPDHSSVRGEWLVHLRGHVIERVGVIPKERRHPTTSKIYYWRLTDAAKEEIANRLEKARGQGMPCCNATEVKWETLDNPLGGEGWTGEDAPPTASPEQWPYRCQHCGTHHSRTTLQRALDRRRGWETDG